MLTPRFSALVFWVAKQTPCVKRINKLGHSEFSFGGVHMFQILASDPII
jgi:hypothetical protein